MYSYKNDVHGTECNGIICTDQKLIGLGLGIAAETIEQG